MSDIPKQQVYQMWAADGIYLGVLQGVTSKFKRVQDINTCGPSTIEIKVSMNLDTPIMPVKAITTEDGKWITTEDGVGLTTEGEQPNFAVDKSKIRNGNIVQIVEISPNHPNGITVFKGRVKKWVVNFGSTDDARLRVVPLSDDMNSRIVRTGAQNTLNQLSYGSNALLMGSVNGASPETKAAYAFDFSAAGITNLSAVTLRLGAVTATPAPVTLGIVDIGIPPFSSGSLFAAFDGPHVTSATVTVTTGGASFNSTEYTFTFADTYYFHPDHEYALVVTSSILNGSGNNPYVGISDANQTNFGASYIKDGSGWYLSDFVGIYGDFYFKFYGIPPYTKSTITNFEPSTLLKTIIDNYNAEGGVVTYTPTSIQSTGITIPTYTFQTNTIAQGLDILLSLSPQGFYYTIDPGTNVLTFKKISATADHILVFRQDIQELDLSASIEKLKNDIYFTGGVVSGSSIFVNKKNQTSINNFGNEIELISDVNVIDESVGASIATNYLDKVDDEVYETDVQLIDGQVDITAYKLGETIGFANSGTFPDTVIIPIVRISRDMDIGDFSLGTLPVRQTDYIQESREDISALQNVANPIQPS